MRGGQGRVAYPLPEILLLPLRATLSGMENFVEIRLWGEERLDFPQRFLPYKRGLPAHDTLNDVINGLDGKLFKNCFATWVESMPDGDPDIIAIGGKTSRRGHARAKGREPLHSRLRLGLPPAFRARSGGRGREVERDRRHSA